MKLQRFAVGGREIGTQMGVAAEGLKEYRLKKMYLDDLSSCADKCTASA